MGIVYATQFRLYKLLSTIEDYAIKAYYYSDYNLKKIHIYIFTSNITHMNETYVNVPELLYIKNVTCKTVDTQ